MWGGEDIWLIFIQSVKVEEKATVYTKNTEILSVQGLQELLDVQEERRKSKSSGKTVTFYIRVEGRDVVLTHGGFRQEVGNNFITIKVGVSFVVTERESRMLV